jgi:hypothetical protein
MVTCPYCHFANEDGALFCEQCKSDLGLPESAAVEVPLPAPDAGSLIPVAAVATQPVPFAAVAEVAAPTGEALVADAALAEAVPVAQLQVDGSGSPLAAVAVALTEPMPAAAETIQGLTAPAAPPQAPVAAPTPSRALPPGVQPRLVVVRGLRMAAEYPLYPGPNYLGRADEKPVDIDLEDQESAERIFSSRQHAVILFEEGTLTIEDLNSANGTFVNRTRVHPGQKRPLQEQDIIQLGTVWLKVQI